MSKKYVRALALAAILLFPAFITLIENNPPAMAAAPAGFSDRLVAGGLNVPVSMEFAPDGRLFVTEKDGTVRVIKDGQLLQEPFASLDANSEGERGLQGIALDPDFESNGYLYVYYTTASDPVHNRVSRLAADPANPDRMLAGSEQPLLDLETLTTVSHNGGGLAFGPDGMLYVSTGDNYFPYLAESLTSRFGKILRINPDGTIPTDNPFYDVQGAYREIWATGLRNPFSFEFSSSWTMYINDVGQDSWEEINPGSAGADYGWPSCEGACSDPESTDPVYYYEHGSNGASVTGGAFYEASQFPSEYRGSYFFGDYVLGSISRLTPSGEVEPFLTDVSAPVDTEVGPDGHLYYLSIVDGQVRKVLFTTAGNFDPAALASANQTQGLEPLAVEFDASGSTDPNGDSLTYSWDFGDGSPPSGQASVTHVYDSPGMYDATLTVEDGNGGSDTDTLEITVGNPPSSEINAPADGASYSAGDTISFSGSATDEEDGTLPAEPFEWTVVFYHNTHTHPFQEYSGVTGGEFTIPTVGETSDDVWYRINLEVTDSSGLTHQSTRDLVPNTSTVTLQANVTGLQVLLDGQPHTSPHVFTGVVGTERTVEAPALQLFNGAVYGFVSWSDGGERSHTMQTPGSGQTVTANYSEGSSTQHTLTVRSADLEGNELGGRYATIESPRGTIVHEGFTPFDFTGYENIQYTVVIRDHSGSTFDHWDDGSTTRVRTLTMSNATEITAFYRTVAAAPEEPEEPPEVFGLIINAADDEGNPLAVHAVVENAEDGEVMQEGGTPLNYTSTAGNSYEVTVQDNGNAVFDGWADGSTDRTRTVVLDSDTTLTASYRIEAEETDSEEDDGAVDTNDEEEDDDDDGSTGGGAGGGGGTGSGNGGAGGGTGGGGVGTGDGGTSSPSNTYPPSYFESGDVERFTLESDILNGDGTSSQIEGNRIVVEASFRNWQQVTQDYAAIIQVEDGDGITRNISWITDELPPGETGTATRSLTVQPDKYVVKVFVWDKIEQGPSPLADMSRDTLVVE